MNSKSSLLKLTLMAAACGLALGNVSGFASEGGYGSHGGGGIIRQGKVLTFGSAGVKLDVFLNESEIPSYGLLLEGIQALGLPDEVLAKLLSAAVASDGRTYFAVQPKDLTPQKLTEIVAIYQQTVSVQPSDQVVIHAITQGKETYLLPTFFELSTNEEKAAILFHEALWAMGATDYATVIDAEIRFEKWLKNGKKYSTGLFQSLVKVFGDPSIPVVAAAQDDLRNHRFDAYLVKGSTTNWLPFCFLFPCDEAARKGSGLYYEFYSMQVQKYPDLKLFQALFNAVPSISVEFAVFGWNEFRGMWLRPWVFTNGEMDVGYTSLIRGHWLEFSIKNKTAK